MGSRAKFSVTGVKTLQYKLRRLDDEVNRDLTNTFNKGATEIRDLARKYAPRDLANLEEAIKTEKSPSKKRIDVYVDTKLPVPERPGHFVGEYARRMHEGYYDLGKRSLAKQSRLKVKVGRKYLERALKDLRAPLIKKMENLVRKIVAARK